MKLNSPYPIPKKMPVGPTHHTAVVAAGCVECLLSRILVTNLVLEGKLDCGRIITDPPAQALAL